MSRIISLLALILICASCTTTPGVPAYLESVRGGYELSEEERYIVEESTKYYRDLHNSGLIVSDPDTQAYIDKIVYRLVRDIDLARSIDALIVRSPKFNAHAMGDRKIYINSGVFSITDNEDQLAALIAHEIIHLIEQHNLKAHIARKNTMTTAKTASFFTLGLSMLPAVSSMAKYAKLQEQEADEKALSLMKNGGFDPAQMLQLLHNLERVSRIPSKESEADDVTGSLRIDHLAKIISTGIPNLYETPPQPLAEKVSSKIFDNIRSQRIRENISMRLRGRQYQMALNDLDVLTRYEPNKVSGEIALFRGLAYLGLSKHLKHAAEERSVIETGSTSQWETYYPLVEQNISTNRNTARDFLHTALHAHVPQPQAALKLGELETLDRNTESALRWLHYYQTIAADEREIQYADFLIDRLRPTNVLRE